MVSLEEIVETCKIGSSSLDQEVSDLHYYDISRYLSEWKLIAPELNITEPELKAIESDFSTEERRRIGFLKKWKQKKSFKATYRVLVNALLHVERADIATSVCQLLNETGQFQDEGQSEFKDLQQNFAATNESKNQAESTGDQSEVLPSCDDQLTKGGQKHQLQTGVEELHPVAVSVVKDGETYSLNLLMPDASSKAETGKLLEEMALQSKLDVEITEETHFFNQVPDENSSLVKAETGKLLGAIDLQILADNLNHVGHFIRIAYNGIGAAGPKFIYHQIEVQRLVYDVMKLCDKSRITVDQFRQATISILTDLQSTYGYLLDNDEQMALVTMSSVSKQAEDMVKAARGLQKEFDEEGKKVVEVLEKTQKARGAEALHIKQMEKEREQMELKRQEQELLIMEYITAQQEAEARRRDLEQQGDKAIAEIGSASFWGVMKKMVNSLTSKIPFVGTEVIDSEKRAVALKECCIDANEKEQQINQNRQAAIHSMTEFACKIKHCETEENMAKIAEDALHQSIGALQELSFVMMQAAIFWKQMQNHCKSLEEANPSNQVEKAMRLYSEETSRGFKIFYAGWVALFGVCDTYIQYIQATQQDLHCYINTEFRQNLKELAEQFLTDLKHKKRAGSLQRKTGRQCVAIVESALDDIVKGKARNASAKLHELEGDIAYLVAEAGGLTRRLKMIEDHHIHEGEKIQIEIGNLGSQEEALRQQKNREETKLASNRSVLWDNESRLRSVEGDVQSAERMLEQAKKEKARMLTTGHVIGGLAGIGMASAIGGGIPITAMAIAAGAGFGGGVGGTFATRILGVARDNLERHKENCQRARSAVEMSERNVASISSQIVGLEKRIGELKMERLSYHEKVSKIKEAILFLKHSLEFWELFKQAAEHGGQRTSLLCKIVDKANEMGNYHALTSRSIKQVAMTFLEAWDSLESLAIEGQASYLLQIDFTCSNCSGHYTALPYVHNSQFVCAHCN